MRMVYVHVRTPLCMCMCMGMCMGMRTLQVDVVYAFRLSFVRVVRYPSLLNYILSQIQRRHLATSHLIRRHPTSQLTAATVTPTPRRSTPTPRRSTPTPRLPGSF